MSKFLKVTDSYHCTLMINKDLVDLVEENLHGGGAKITSLKAGISWNVQETVIQIMKQMEDEQ